MTIRISESHDKMVLALMSGQALAATQSIGIVPPAGESTIAFGVNAAGQVAAVLEDQDGRQRGVIYEKGVLTELALMAGGHSDTKAINANGQEVQLSMPVCNEIASVINTDLEAKGIQDRVDALNLHEGHIIALLAIIDQILNGDSNSV